MFGEPRNYFPLLGRQHHRDDATRIHTWQAGTLTFMAPEVNDCRPYGMRSDLWCMGVVLLELVQMETMKPVKASQAESIIQQRLQKLPDDKPFPTMVRDLLMRDPGKRWTARQCLTKMSETLFANYGIPAVRIMNMKEASPLDEQHDKDVQKQFSTSSRNTISQTVF
jgi:serine/threonine protein kinase